MSYTRARKLGFALLLVALLGGMTAMPAASTADNPGNNVINYSSTAAPQAELVGDVTIDHHRMGDHPLTYNNDNGEWTRHKGSINESVDNPYEFYATDVNFSDAGAFPHSKDVSALTAAEWSVSGDNASSLSVNDVETAPGVNALEITTDGSFAAGDNATATFSNFSITSEENKRYLQLVGDINTLESGTIIEVKVYDANGDYYTAEVNTSRSSGEDLIANSTGQGYIFQRQLGQMSLTSAGDGTFDDIESVKVTVKEGDADLELSAVNVEKMSKYDWGSKLADTDSDDELESNTIHENKDGGALKLSDLDTMGTTFESADIKGLTVPFEAPISALATEDVDVSFENAPQWENYDSHFVGYARFSLPDAYDLSYANVELQDKVSVPGSRYVTVKYAEGTGDTAFEDISSWSDITSSYSSVGANVTVDDTIQPGASLVIKYDYVVSSSEKKDLQPNTGIVGPTGSQDKSTLDQIFGIPGMLATGVLAFLGGKKLGWL